MSTSFVSGGIAEAITHDHNGEFSPLSLDCQPLADQAACYIELKDYYAKYQSASTEKEKNEWSNQFRWELARHSVGEELLLYPAFEKHFGAEGKRMADEDRAEHQVVSLLDHRPSVEEADPRCGIRQKTFCTTWNA